MALGVSGWRERSVVAAEGLAKAGGGQVRCGARGRGDCFKRVRGEDGVEDTLAAGVNGGRRVGHPSG